MADDDRVEGEELSASRRTLRQLARRAVKLAAADMGLSARKFRKLMEVADEEATSALILAVQSIGGAEVADWKKRDWQAFFTVVMELIMAWMLMF